MAIAEIFLSAFITVLFEKLASGELLKLPSIKGVDDKIKKWRKDLRMINAVLGDAEEKQITDASVKLWLEELQDLAYDMDDMLDELNTHLSVRKEPESSTSTSKPKTKKRAQLQAQDVDLNILVQTILLIVQQTKLKGLSNLKGRLHMVGMQNIGSVKEAREANLMGKGGLDKLKMGWNGNFEDSRDEGIESQVLDVLKPQPGLEWLDIEYNGGTSFRSWVGEPSFSSMVHLMLNGCKNCTSLPSLGQLPCNIHATIIMT